ncbi:intraflagellar transport protein 22 homolog isoform X2 [Hydra vulgaris]|uniref:Intraflagellar transport protein 22 homolog isoform X2 n=1 Tax=Hydra vulgaris TaxID=6087 RepID=A0ABM4CPB2_HYDVU
MFNKIKILVLGPKQSGKTFLSNFIADATESTSGEYRSTKGVRILEFEVEGIDIGGNHTVNLEVELWDCSGDQRYEGCWPALQKGANGLIFVYNPDVTAHEKELESWYLHFSKQQGIKDQQCIVFAHSKSGNSGSSLVKLNGNLGRVSLINTNFEEDSEGIKNAFKRFLSSVLSHVNDSRDQEELSIIE